MIVIIQYIPNLLSITSMSKPIVGDQFDYLFKLVVVGGTNILN